MKLVTGLLAGVILVALLIVPEGALAYEEDWLVELSLTTGPHIGTVPGEGYLFAFGVRDGASEGYGEGEGDLIAPPDPMTGINAYFYYPGNPVNERKLVASVMGPADTVTWPLCVRSVGNPGATQATLSWDESNIDNVPAKYTVSELRDTDGNVLADIRGQASYTFVLQSGETKNFRVVVSEASYTLSVSSTSGGSVTTPGEGIRTYDAGTVVSLLASPASGYRFISWTGDVGTIASTGAASTSITMNGNYSISANFEQIPPGPFGLTLSSTAGGSVTTPGEGSFTCDAGSVVNLVATPEGGYGFVAWTGDVSTVANLNAASTTITMNGHYSVNAWFMAKAVESTTQTVTDGVVDAIEQADTEVQVAGTATVTVVEFSDNPGGEVSSGFSSVGKYIDVHVPDTTEVTEIVINLHYTDAEVAEAGVSESSLRLFWWDDAQWKQCSDSGVNTTDLNGYSGWIWARIRTDTSPSLAELTGTEFGGFAIPRLACFIATAAYGTDTAAELDILREFRDTVLLPNTAGARLVSLYYQTSPPIARFISQHEVLRTVVRVSLIDPLIAVLNISYGLWSTRG